MRLRAALSRPGILVPGDWLRAEVQPWDRDRIEAFLLKSFGLDRDRFDQIYSHERIREMARSPIALAILADVYRRTGALPTDRSTLLRAYVETLLSQRDAAKNLSELRSTTSPQTIRRRLAEIAFDLLRRGTDVFRLEDLETWADPQDELRYLAERTGLVREIAEGRYTFSHRSLFEHFAAEGLADLGAREALTFMLEHEDDPLWEDVIILAGSRLLTLIDEWGSALREQLTGILARLAENPRGPRAES